MVRNQSKIRPATRYHFGKTHGLQCKETECAWDAYGYCLRHRRVLSIPDLTLAVLRGLCG